MKQALLPFLFVLVLLGAAYVVKMQTSPDAVDRGDVPLPRSEKTESADAEESVKSVAKKTPQISGSGDSVASSAQDASKKKGSQAFKASVLPRYSRVSLPPQATRPTNYAKPTLNVAYWKKQYAGEPIKAKEWTKAWNGGFWTSWFNGKSEEVAKKYITTIGPLGLRVYMHDKTWTKESAFIERAPEVLKDSTGQLLVNALEVVDVLPGSPSEGHLKPGDLIVAIDGKSLISATNLEISPALKHQGARSLGVHTGWLLDQAEGRGRIQLKILRDAKIARQPSGEWSLATEQAFKHAKLKAPHPFEVKVQGGLEVKLVVTDGGNGNGSDGFCWKDVRLKGGGKTIPVSALKITNAQVGYGRLKKTENETLWEMHAPSVLQFDVPKGSWTMEAEAVPRGGATVVAQVQVRKKPTVSRELLRQVKTVSFPIVKMGSFTKGFPEKDVKSANIIAQQSAWLAVQQMPDGSWQRPSGYTSNHYDTAWAGLGLMATGNPEFDENIKKAAQFLAFKAKTDGWAVPSSVVVVFLSEYWLRYQDDSVLPGLRSWVDCLLTESMTGDYTVGHGHNPGYRGGGVSTGGSHVALALAMAEKTPMGVDKEIVDRMLYRVQQLAPDGFVPYGRGRGGEPKFEPALDGAGTYSGRHGPYLIASLLHGGPKLFTENCAGMYQHCQRGGIDQGHATETLSTQWAFIAMAASDLPSYREHLEALKWKITLRRAFNGGYTTSAWRLEYAGGESLLDYAIRSSTWLIALCADKQNLAITGNPKYRAKYLVDVPPTTHTDAMLRGYYLRNWGVADAVLGERSPASLKAALQVLKSMALGSALHGEMEKFLTTRALPVAREIMALDGLAALQRAYLAELVLGVDHRIDLLDHEKSPSTMDFTVKVVTQHPLAGLGLDFEKLKSLGLVMKGSVSFPEGDGLDASASPVSFDSAGKVDWKKWHTSTGETIVMSRKSGAFEAVAHFDYTVGDLRISYDRPLLFNQGEEWGNGEKQRKVVNDRRVWVPGLLSHDHARWNISFLLPSGQWIAAATQGNDIKVHDAKGDWISPKDHALQKGSVGEFCYTSGWQRIECRVPEFRLQSAPEICRITSIAQSGHPLPEADDLLAGKTCEIEVVPDEVISVKLSKPYLLDAIDLRADKVRMATVEAKVDGQWEIVHIGHPITLVKQLKKVTSDELRMTFTGDPKGMKIKLLRIYQK
jgi:hypothetical protein